MMKTGRFGLIALLLLGLALTACGGDDKKEEKKFTIGVLNFTASMDIVYDGFKAGMADLGYTEGENLTYVYELSENNSDALLAAANRLLAQNVDLILALATPSALAAKAATTEVPVVFTPINDPVSSGIVPNLSAPGGNLTGIRVGGFVPKELEALLTIAGEDVNLILAPYNPNDSSSVVGWEVAKESAELQGVELLTPEVTSAEDIAAVLAAVPEDVDGILMLTDAMIASQAPLFAQTGIDLGIPTIGISADVVVQGVLASYGFDFYQSGYQTARLADQIFKGAKPQNLPVETAEFYLSINLITAEASGIEITDELLRQAQSGLIIRSNGE